MISFFWGWGNDFFFFFFFFLERGSHVLGEMRIFFRGKSQNVGEGRGEWRKRKKKRKLR